jgi:hypothetical protein
LTRRDHHARKLQRDWEIHGNDAFAFSIVESVPDHNELTNRENHHLTVRRTQTGDDGYNSPHAPAYHLTRMIPIRLMSIRISQEAFDMIKTLSSKHFPLVPAYGTVVDLAIRRMYEQEQKEGGA